MLPIKKILFGLGVVLASGLAQAGIITLAGDHFTASYDEALVDPLYKGALLSGSMDTVYFLPVKFAAVTGGAPASRLAALQLTLNIAPGYSFAGIEFAESGEYFLSTGGQVFAEASLRATNPDTLASTLLDLSSPAFGVIGVSSDWVLAGVLGPAGLGAPEALTLSFDSTLHSQPSGGIGFMAGTYVGFRVLTQAKAVPEPSGLALLLAGTLAAWAARRRRL